MSDIEEMSIQENNMSKQKDNKWSNYGLRILVNTASHPFEYAKVLIQIGFEPLPPRPSKNLWGQPVLRLPTIFEYVKHIKAVDGFAGLYKGLAPKLCGNLLSSVVAEKCSQLLKKSENENDDENAEPVEETDEMRKQWLELMKNDIIIHTAAIIVSQPFHVITIRMMAEFVGKEAKHVGIFSSIKEIYHQNGILGFFSGLIPRVLGDILSVLLAGTLTFIVNRYIVNEKEIKTYIAASMNFIGTATMYPFQVVSNTMAVTNSGLAIGSPNYMPHYNSWIDCWIDLSRKRQLKRGASLIFRYYTGPQVNIGGKLMPVIKGRDIGVVQS